MATTTVKIGPEGHFTRHYVYLLVAVFLVMGAATIVFFRWSSLEFAEIETETYEYHLSTMHNCAKVREVIRLLEYEHLQAELARSGGTYGPDQKQSRHLIYLFLVRDALAEMHSQQQRYNNPEFVDILDHADALFASVMALRPDAVLQLPGKLKKLNGMLSQMLVVMDQLQRLHAIAYDEHRLMMPVQRRQWIQKMVLGFLVVSSFCLLLTAKILARIKDGEGLLRNFYEELQGRVDDRTAKLFNANATLQGEVSTRKMVEGQLAQAKAEAEAANQAKSDFLANMSHEIRTPMNAIMGMNRLALEGNCPPQIKKYLQVVEKSAQTLLLLINDILDFSKIEAGQLELCEHSFYLPDFLESLLANFTAIAEERGNTLILELGDEVSSSLIGDDLRLQQILLNLVGNAMKFTENGQITVGVEVNQESEADITLQFKVADTGVGIPADLHDKIFKSFSQADNSISRQHGGTGLGLTICKQLTALLGGTIWLQSQEGQGSTFYFTVSLKKGGLHQHGAVEKPMRGDHAVLRKLNILLVEDNQFNQDLAKIVLEQEGHQVRTALNGLEALELLSADVFDLVLMDVQMPVMDGLGATSLVRLCETGRAPEAQEHQELLLKLQDKIDGRHVPIIAMTAHALTGDRERFIEAGMDDYIAKPFQPDELFRIFDTLVGEIG